MATGGFNFGASASGTGTGIMFGAQKTTAPAQTLPSLVPASTAPLSLGFNFGGAKTTAATTAAAPSGFNFAFPGSAKTTASTGFGLPLGAAATTTTAAGLTLGGGTAATTTSGFNFGLTPAATSAAATSAPTLGVSTAGGGLTGFNFGATTSTTSAPTLGLGGLGSTTSTAGNIFSKATATPSVTGLGGVDPKTSGAGTGSTGGLGSGSDGKALKEMHIPDQLVTAVDEMQKYVKSEKSVREDIVRMSSKPMVRVQEDIAALKQLLSVVSNGLQRNGCTLEKLKAEMTQELKNAEMAQRTKDIPPGLQYENTAPNEYFEQVVEQFEGQMLSYRQQIEMLENHLSAVQQPVRHSPAEIFTLMKRLHETFIALAARLQQVHEAMKAQKEQFVTYRRVFHGDTKDIFQDGAPVVPRPVQHRHVDTSGPTPFPGITNAAAAAMASVMSRTQQSHGPPVAGLLGNTGSNPSWLGGGGVPTGGGGLLGGLLSQTDTGAGSGLGAGGLFGSSSTGTTAAAAASFNNNSLANTLGSLNNTANASFNVSAATKQPFTLQKPPPGAKRGKR